VVVCPNYGPKEWTGLEWNAIHDLIKKRRVDEVLLTRFNHADLTGLYSAGYIELDTKTPAEAALLILQRLALNEGYPKDYYTGDALARPDWPVVAPQLDWPVADHTEAQGAFAKLITRGAPFRILPIRGSSETGKSHLTRQFLGNALNIQDLTCGRFDFKATSDMDDELRTFTDGLEVPTPTPGPSVSNQLASVFASLKEKARPTLLIFDTFERAGEAERWVKESLLLAVKKAPWLRVIIVGQQVPNKYGEPWAGSSSEPIELRPPTPQEWFDFGKPHHHDSPDFTIEWVRSLHATVKGKSSVLAQVCGPPT
jgi:hypothetical protein